MGGGAVGAGAGAADLNADIRFCIDPPTLGGGWVGAGGRTREAAEKRFIIRTTVLPTHQQ